jgi:hypothetical protein
MGRGTLWHRTLLEARKPARASLFYDPKVRHRLSGCSDRTACRWRLVDRQQHDRKPAAVATSRTGFRFPAWARRFRHLRHFDPLQLRFDLWPRLAGRLGEHGPRRCVRHNHGDHHGFLDRHCASVEQLAAPQDRDGLCRNFPQHTAAAGHPVPGIRACWRCCHSRATATRCRSDPI